MSLHCKVRKFGSYAHYVQSQVTIPARIREEAGLLPHTEVEFITAGRGEVRLVKAAKKSGRKSRGELLVEHMRGKGDVKLTTDEIMAMTRGEGE